MTATPPADELKRRAGEAAAAEVTAGMRLGVGTGSTAEAFVRALAPRVRAGLKLVAVPTSERTAALCRAEGIPLTTLDETPALDLCVDGADEIGPHLALIKGGGGALLREKIVASASAAMVVIADASKLVQALGAFPLPIEVVPFGVAATRAKVEKLAGKIGLSGAVTLRGKSPAAPFMTDGGHYILDASFSLIRDPEALAAGLKTIPGVVEHGLFLGLASVAIIARGERIERLRP
ncbi:MAG: ribose-5-phosphate isomerase RpiA [Bauldia sp.]|mgnify:CR=1 FL=1